MSDSTSDPARYFGREVRRARLAAGMTLIQFGHAAGYHYGQVSRIETGRRPATLQFAQMCDKVFPERGGWFEDFYRESRKWVATPPWFRNWIEHEHHAVSLKVWQPSQLSGLLQTDGYAHAQLRTFPRVTDDQVSERLAARMARQAILTRQDPPAPMAWFLIDEAALRRWTGTPAVMADQLDQLVTIAALPNVTIQVVPNVAHAALTGGFAIAEKPDTSVAYLETALTGQVFEDSPSVHELATLFDALRTEALRGTESLRVIEKVASEWRSQATGASPATQAPTEASASK
jgi:hypothetical protein